MATPINSFLLQHELRIVQNPCISPDFCLDWPALRVKISQQFPLHLWPLSGFTTSAGDWMLVEDLATGDCAWRLTPNAGVGASSALDGEALTVEGTTWFPATFENLLRLKNLILEHDSDSTIFPGTRGTLGHGTLGVGARFTTLHWPAVDWVMSELGISLTANQNSIPRELVYDVNAMLGGKLDSVPFPFIGTSVPEGHQGQSVEGMSHGCILEKLRSGFHARRIPWSFNADHQPIGGKFDIREEALVRGCLLASYITFDLSPELASGTQAILADIPADLIGKIRDRVTAAGSTLDDAAFAQLLTTVWPAMLKMKRRDDAYTAARKAAFTTIVGQDYLRELSIDELPGLTTPETTAIMLALCEALSMKIHFIAPAFGFQKNMPYPDNTRLRKLIQLQWNVCQSFGVGIGFHSGSGKSAENYRIMGEVTGGRLEIKTSGRYTYEMGRALSDSTHPDDQALWRDWHQFTVEMAITGAFAEDTVERDMARSFILAALKHHHAAADPVVIFSDPAATRLALETLPASPENMFWFEYNFLHVLAANGTPEKSGLGDHSPSGYRQRARFYSITPEARLNYTKNVARYLLFLAENTGLASKAACAAARSKLENCLSLTSAD
ncbi:MAG: tagaturonate epimerase family protein [Terrimicrobiaceae bacterium]